MQLTSIKPINNELSKAQQCAAIKGYLKDCFLMTDSQIKQHITKHFADLVPHLEQNND